MLGMKGKGRIFEVLVVEWKRTPLGMEVIRSSVIN